MPGITSNRGAFSFSTLGTAPRCCRTYRRSACGVSKTTGSKVTRLAEPALQPNRTVVDVNYEIIVQEKGGTNVAFINETHPVRYFFDLEIEELFTALAADILTTEEWLTGRTIGLDTFSVCFVARKPTGR